MPDLVTPTAAEIERDWHEFTGGPPVVGALGTYAPGDVEALAIDRAGQHALVTWSAAGDTAELVSVHASPPGAGTGAELLAIVEARLSARGVTRVVVATTNDNTRAARFYQRHGYRLVRVVLDHMDEVRKLKPGVSLTGIDDLPLRDLWVLEKSLV